MTDKIVLNAMTPEELQKMLDKDEIKLSCAQCFVKIDDIKDISGLVSGNGEIKAICTKTSCKEFVWENCMEKKD